MSEENRRAEPRKEPQSTEIAAPRTQTGASSSKQWIPDVGLDPGSLLYELLQEQAISPEGEVVRGTIVRISEHEIVIDFGYESDGIANPAEFTENGILAVKIGDEVDVLVKNLATQGKLPVLSRVDAILQRAWDDLEKSYREGKSIKGRVVQPIKQGLWVSIGGIPAYLPGSQVDPRPVFNLNSLRNQEIEAKVIDLDRKRATVVLSRKAIIEEENAERRRQRLQQIEEDMIVDGQIKHVTEFGVFVDLGGVDGLLHLADMAWGDLRNPSELFRVGEKVKVKVLRIDRERDLITLGYKQLFPEAAGDPSDDLDIIGISTSEVVRLSAKTAEVLQEMALSYERITKDREEIELLKTETRAMLAQLSAA